MDDSLEQKNTEKYFADHHRYGQPTGEYREVIPCSCQILGGFVPLLGSGEASNDWDEVKDCCEEKEEEERQEEVAILEQDSREGQSAHEETDETEDWEFHFFYISLPSRKLKQKDINLPSSICSAASTYVDTWIRNKARTATARWRAPYREKSNVRSMSLQPVPFVFFLSETGDWLSPISVEEEEG